MKARIPKGPTGQGNINDLMKQAQIMQQEVSRLTEELQEREYEIKAGGGLVRLLVGGDKMIKEIEISPEIVDPDDIDTLQELIVAAVNEAISTVETTTTAEIEKVTGSFGLPGMV